LAALINADVSLVIYREFSYLRNRLLLDREIELAQLEKALMTQDDELARTCPKVLSTRIVKDVCDEPSFEKSRSLMNTIYNKLKEYGQWPNIPGRGADTESLLQTTLSVECRCF
jgi:hypothetical protein